jgi:hypothetical protein
MLTQISNFAIVQFIQMTVVVFFVFISTAIVCVRLKLPKNKVEWLADIIMCLIILIYAVVLNIFFST